MPMIQCPYCDDAHGDRLLCDAAKRVLDALKARGMEMNMPTLEFPAPVDGKLLGLGQPGDAMMTQLVVQGATVQDGAGVHRPLLIFTGRDQHRQPLPRWLYPAAPADLTRTVRLVEQMSALAVRAARQANGR